MNAEVRLVVSLHSNEDQDIENINIRWTYDILICTSSQSLDGMWASLVTASSISADSGAHGSHLDMSGQYQ